MSRPTYLTIDIAALRHNLARVKTFAPGRAIIAMIKANAYGHGLVRIANACGQADALGVASLEEGILLREAGITQPIVLMEGLFYNDELDYAAQHDFTLVVHHSVHVDMLEKVKGKKPFSVWLKINTGMNRLGVGVAEFNKIYKRLCAISTVKKPIGLMTHFAEADQLDSNKTKDQLTLFKQCVGQLPGPHCLANSAAIMAWPDAHADWVRPGLMLYGATPFAGKTGVDFDLKPVMTLSSRLIAINHLKPGDKVGYGGTWTAANNTLIGVVGVGYGDGYPQYAKNDTPVLVNGIESRIVGRVSMDMLTVDLSQQPDAQIGDPVILWGKGLPVERIALKNDTSAYEILTRMTPRPKIEVKHPEYLESAKADKTVAIK